MERGRTEYLRACGIDQGAAMASGDNAFGFVVRAMTIDFLRPARMDDLLTIETTPVEMKAASFTLEQRVLRGAEALATATVRCACVIAGRAARLPKNVKERMESGPP